MKTTGLLSLCLLLILSACAAPQPVDHAAVAVADPLRPADDRKRDADRKPAEILNFFGVAPGMKVLDLQASNGYYTEILSGLVGPDGVVYAQNNHFVLTRFAEAPLQERIDRLAAAGRTNIVRIDAEVDAFELPEPVDVALFVRFYHDLFWLPTPDGDLADREEFLRRVYDALQPGGVFAVVDHHAEAGSGDRDAVDPGEGLHRVDAELVMAEILAAGFVLDGESDLLAHPEDTRDWNIFADESLRRDQTDRFVYRFRKPE